MWDMSRLIRKCENFNLFYSFCPQLVVDTERQTRDYTQVAYVRKRGGLFMVKQTCLHSNYIVYIRRNFTQGSHDFNAKRLELSKTLRNQRSKGVLSLLISF